MITRARTRLAETWLARLHSKSNPARPTRSLFASLTLPLHSPARKLNSAPDLEGHDDLDHVLSFHPPSAKDKKKAMKKKKKKRQQYHGRRGSQGVHFNSSISDDR